MSAEQWEVLKQELRKDADREMAATQNQSRKDSIRSRLDAVCPPAGAQQRRRNEPTPRDGRRIPHELGEHR